MTSRQWCVALGVAAFALCWLLLFAASNARHTNRYAMFIALAGFLLGLLGLLLMTVGGVEVVYPE